MTATAEHLIDRVVPHVPVRQWVLTVPHALRYRMAYDPALCSDVLRVFSRALLASYRRRAREGSSIANAQTGAVTFIQRFGSALNLNVHFHTQVLDGVFTQALDGALRFQPLPPPPDDQVQSVLEEVVCRMPRILAKHRLDDPDGLDPAIADAPLLAACQAASVVQRAAFGPRAGLRPPRLGARPDVPWIEPKKSCHAQLDGFDLHAAVHVPAHARDRLEQLLRYCARPPLSHDRLEPFDDGRLRLTLKTPWHDGTTHVLLTPDELLQRLVAIIPRPDKNLVVYHGVLAANAKWRKQVAAYGRSPSSASATQLHPHPANESALPEHPRPRRPNRDWARLMQRAFEIDVLECPHCGERMRLLALIQNPRSAARILRHLGLRDHAPPIAPARTPSFDFDDVA